MAKALFAIRDSSRRKATACAFLNYSDDEGFTVDIEPTVSSSEVPAFFIPFVEQGKYHIPPELSLRWVRERVPPPSRQNIGEILKAHGLSEYSELALLRSGRGESSQDSFVIEEIDCDASRSAVVDALTDERKELGEEIKARRNGLGITQRELADIIGISQPALSKIEAGKGNPTFDILSAIDRAVSSDGRPLLNKTQHALWDKHRRSIQNQLESYAPALSQVYCRLINELETYDENNPSSIADSRIISHCFRELMDSFSIHVDGLALSGKQGPENEAMKRLLALLDGWSISKGNEVTIITPELRDALIRLQEAHAAGSETNRQKMQVSVSGAKANEAAPISAWEKAHGLAVSTAHLPRKKSAEVPAYSEYHDSLVILENSIGSRIGDIYEVKGNLVALIDKANRVDASEEFMRPRSDEVDNFISSVGNDNLQIMAFRKLKNPYWLEALEEAGFFGPYLVLDESSGADLLPAPFLSECLKFDHKRVLSMVERMAEKGWAPARRFMVEAAADLLDHELGSFSDKIFRWARDGYGIGTYFWTHCNADSLILGMLESGNGQLAKKGEKLFQQLVRLRKREIDSYPYEEVVSCIQEYSYARFVHEIMPALPLNKRLALSRNNLNEYVRPLDVSKPLLDSRYFAYSLSPDELEEVRFCRTLLVPWIEEYKAAARDALQNGSDEVLGSVLKQKPLVLRCFMSSLHEYIQSATDEVLGEAAYDALIQICLDEETLLNREYEGEVVPLLSDFAIYGSEDAKERFLHSFKGWLDSWEKVQSKNRLSDSPDKIKTERRFLEHRILSVFPMETLPDHLQKRRAELENEMGIYDGPYMLYKVTTIVGPNSPLSVEDFREKGSERTLDWLKDWEPTEQDRAVLIEHEGVARTLTALIEEDPTFFKGCLPALKKQKLIYITAVLAGWQKAVEEGYDIPLNDAIELCSWVLSAQNSGSIDSAPGHDFDDNGFESTIQRIGWFLIEVLESKKTRLDEEALHDALEILLELRKHALTSPRQESVWDNEEDCITASLNETSSIALSGIMQWVMRDDARLPEDIENALESIDKAIPNPDSSMADIAAFALKMPGLLIDRWDWLERRYDRLFGGDTPSEHQRLLLVIQVSAFAANPRVFDFLRPALAVSIKFGMEQYPAIKGIGRLSGYAESLGFDFFQLFAAGKLDLTDDLLTAWIESADPQAIGAALEKSCSLICASPDTTEKIAYRIRLLWDSLASTSKAQEGVLRGAFHLASSNLYEHAWLRKALMEESRSHNCVSEMRGYCDDVYSLASECPEWGIALLRSVIENDNERNKYDYERMSRLLFGLYRKKFGNQDSDDATYCMNELGRMGILDLDTV